VASGFNLCTPINNRNCHKCGAKIQERDRIYLCRSCAPDPPKDRLDLVLVSDPSRASYEHQGTLYGEPFENPEEWDIAGAAESETVPGHQSPQRPFEVEEDDPMKRMVLEKDGLRIFDTSEMPVKEIRDDGEEEIQEEAEEAFGADNADCLEGPEDLSEGLADDEGFASVGGGD